MNRDELNEWLATQPATPNQRGAIMREFARLGFREKRDRAERLATCAKLLGLDELRSTSDLVMGEAGQLVNILQRVRDRSELAAGAESLSAITATDEADDDQGGEDQGEDAERNGNGSNGGMTLAEALKNFALIIAAAIYRKPENESSAEPAQHWADNIVSAPRERGESARD